MVSSRCFVVNEWLLHDLRGDNAQEAQDEAIKFLQRLKEKCDQIVVLHGSSWMQKAYDLMSCTNVRALSKYLHLAILRDIEKCRLLEQSEVRVLPDHVRESVPEEDVYLLESYYAANANALVTTDQKLRDLLSSHGSVAVRLRDEFLREYLEPE